MKIISRRHPLKFYLTLILGSAFFIGLGYFLMIISSKKDSSVLVVMAIICYCLTPYTIFMYYRNSPRIVIDNNFISFNSKTYSLSEIAKVDITGKRNFPYLLPYQMEATTIHFTDGSKKFIYDDMHANAWEIKSWLKQVVIQKKEYVPKERSIITNTEIDMEVYDTFKDNQFTSMRGLSLWIVIAMLFYGLFTANPKAQKILLYMTFFFGSFWTIFHGWLMHYFQVSDKILLVRNHIFFWKRKAYLMDDIAEFTFETRDKMPNCLRVITKDYKSKLYPAGTLRNNTWLKLKDRLRSNRKKVRDEGII